MEVGAAAEYLVMRKTAPHLHLDQKKKKNLAQNVSGGKVKKVCS